MRGEKPDRVPVIPFVFGHTALMCGQPLARVYDDAAQSFRCQVLCQEMYGYDGGPLDVIELSSTFSPQELILREALGLDADANVNPSGGALAANPVMATGLVRIAEVAQRIVEGSAGRGLAHATGGQVMQHNLVCLMEGD